MMEQHQQQEPHMHTVPTIVLNHKKEENVPGEVTKSSLVRRSNPTTTHSLDFEEPDGDNLRDHYHSQLTHRTTTILSDLSQYLIALLIALLIACTYQLVHYVTETAAEWRVEKLRTVSDLPSAFGVAVGSCLLFAFIGASFLSFEKEASGSGMPEVIAYLNGVEMPSIMTVRVGVFKTIAMMASVSAGLFTGFDGPLAHVATIIATSVVRGVSKSKGLVGWVYGISSSTLPHRDEKNTPNASVMSIHSHRSRGDAVDKGIVLGVVEKKSLALYGAAGAAAAISAIFRSPVGGVMFALEEAISFYDPSLILRTLFTTVATYLFAGLLYNSNYIGKKIISPLFALFPINAGCDVLITYPDVFSYLILGALGGLLGSFYNRLLVLVHDTRSTRLFQRLWVRYLDLMVVCFVTMAVVVFVPTVPGVNVCTPKEQAVTHMLYTAKKCEVSCESVERVGGDPTCLELVCLPPAVKLTYASTFKNTVRDVKEKCLVSATTGDVFSGFVSPVDIGTLVDEVQLPKQLNQDPENKCYFQLRSLFFSTPDNVIRLLFTRGMYNLFETYSLAIYGTFYLVVSLLTYGTFAPTDLVVPNLIVGATFGRLYGLIMNYIYAYLGFPPVDPGGYALLGLASFWSGTSHLLLTVTAVSIESTYDVNYLIGVVLVTITATVVGRWVGSSQYSLEIMKEGFHYLPHSPPMVLKTVKVSEVMTREVVSVGLEETVGSIVRVVSESDHDGFPVVITSRTSTGEVTKKLVGFVLRSQLEEKVKKYMKLSHHDATSASSPRSPTGPDSPVSIQMGSDKIIDLVPIMNHPPYIVHPDTSASKVFLMFRHLGLRHLCVVDYNGLNAERLVMEPGREGELVGIVTREDFYRYIHDLKKD